MDKTATILPGAPDHHRKPVADLGSGPAGHRPVPTQIKTLTGPGAVHPTPQGCLEAEMAGNPAGLFKLASNSANLNSVVAGVGFEPTTFGL